MTRDPKKFREIARVCAVLSKSAATQEEHFELAVDFLLAPIVALVILHPFEVGNNHSSGIRQYIRNDRHTVIMEIL